MLRYLLTYVPQCSCQNSVCTSFSTKRFSNYHKAMTHNHHLIYLQDLHSKYISHLQIHSSTVCFDGFQQVIVVWFWQLHTRKQIRGNTLSKQLIGKYTYFQSFGLKLMQSILCSLTLGRLISILIKIIMNFISPLSELKL